MKVQKSKVILILAIIGLIGAFFYFDLGQYLSFEYLKAKQSDFQSFYDENPALTIGAYFFIYVIVTALSLPGAAIMTLAGGMLFGLFVGTILVSFASTIGATLAFLVARFMLKDYVQNKFGKNLKSINEGVEKEGSFYLFTLRLVPLFPFFVINLVMGLTPIKTFQFFWVSQVGMLAGTIVYVNAGTQLAQLESLKGILSVEILLSFAALGLVPIVAKKVVELLRRKKANEQA